MSYLKMTFLCEIEFGLARFQAEIDLNRNDATMNQARLPSEETGMMRFLGKHPCPMIEF